MLSFTVLTVLYCPLLSRCTISLRGFTAATSGADSVQLKACLKTGKTICTPLAPSSQRQPQAKETNVEDDDSIAGEILGQFASESMIEYSICVPILSHTEEVIFDKANLLPPVVGILIVVVEVENEAVIDAAAAVVLAAEGVDQTLKAKVAALTALSREHSAAIATALAFEDCRNMERTLSLSPSPSLSPSLSLSRRGRIQGALARDCEEVASVRSIASNEAVDSLASSEEEKMTKTRVPPKDSSSFRKDRKYHRSQHDPPHFSSRNDVVYKVNGFKREKHEKNMMLVGRAGRSTELTRGFFSDLAPRGCSWVPEIYAETIAKNEQAR